MMFRQILLVAAAALPAVALAGGANDIYFTGDGTATAAGEAAADDCDSGIGANYVALNAAQWNSTLSCNRCVEVVCDDDRCSDKAASMTLYVVGKCSNCDDEGLDLSPAVFKKLTGSEPSRYTIKWEFAACPTDSKSTYQAGKVMPADASPSTVSILQENAEGVETSTQQESESETQEANVKAAASSAANGTSPFVVALVVLAVVCGVALAAVAYTAKKRKTHGNEFVTKSFDTFSSPAQKKAAIAKI
jgi:multisubunit Na+/H+ antiporter MnhC subunit